MASTRFQPQFPIWFCDAIINKRNCCIEYNKRIEWSIDYMVGWLINALSKHIRQVRERRQEGIGLYSQLCTFMAYSCVTVIHYKEFHRKQVAQKRTSHALIAEMQHKYTTQLKARWRTHVCVCVHACQWGLHWIQNAFHSKCAESQSVSAQTLHIEREDGSVFCSVQKYMHQKAGTRRWWRIKKVLCRNVHSLYGYIVHT